MTRTPQQIREFLQTVEMAWQRRPDLSFTELVNDLAVLSILQQNASRDISDEKMLESALGYEGGWESNLTPEDRINAIPQGGKING